MHLTIAYTTADLRHLVLAATRRIRLVFLVMGLLLSGAGILGLADSDPAPFVGGLVTAFIGLSLLIASVPITGRLSGRLPATMREPWSFDAGDDGIRLSGPTWVSTYTWAAFRGASLTRRFIVLARASGEPPVTLPRSAFSPEDEARLIAILGERGVVASR